MGEPRTDKSVLEELVRGVEDLVSQAQANDLHMLAYLLEMALAEARERIREHESPTARN